jgi:hypothetical protein
VPTAISIASTVYGDAIDKHCGTAIGSHRAVMLTRAMFFYRTAVYTYQQVISKNCALYDFYNDSIVFVGII